MPASNGAHMHLPGSTFSGKKKAPCGDIDDSNAAHACWQRHCAVRRRNLQHHLVFIHDVEIRCKGSSEKKIDLSPHGADVT